MGVYTLPNQSMLVALGCVDELYSFFLINQGNITYLFIWDWHIIIYISKDNDCFISISTLGLCLSYFLDIYICSIWLSYL